jgi:hypothetical protein
MALEFEQRSSLSARNTLLLRATDKFLDQVKQVCICRRFFRPNLKEKSNPGFGLSIKFNSSKLAVCTIVDNFWLRFKNIRFGQLESPLQLAEENVECLSFKGTASVVGVIKTKVSMF